MKKPKISFRIIGESGSLSLTWSQGPLGNAVEDKNGNGVGFFSTSKDLLGVEFDDVNSKSDQQRLEFNQYIIEVTVKNGKVSHKVINLNNKNNSMNEGTNETQIPN